MGEVKDLHGVVEWVMLSVAMSVMTVTCVVSPLLPDWMVSCGIGVGITMSVWQQYRLWIRHARIVIDEREKVRVAEYRRSIRIVRAPSRGEVRCG